VDETYQENYSTELRTTLMDTLLRNQQRSYQLNTAYHEREEENPESEEVVVCEERCDL